MDKPPPLRYTRVDAGTGRVHPLSDTDWPDNGRMTMPQTTERVFAWARASFKMHVENMLDDPHGMAVMPAYIAEMRQLAADLGLDFYSLCAELGTPYEIKRLRDLEKGITCCRALSTPAE